MRNLFCLSSTIFAICIGLTNPNELHLVESSDIFRNKLDEILTKDTTENTLFSPFSLHTALSVLYLGSDGNTKKMLKEVMNLGEPKETAADYEVVLKKLRFVENVTLEVATKLFVSDVLPLKHEFQNLALQYYSAEEENINFKNRESAAGAINSWVSEKTRNKITEIIEPSSIVNEEHYRTSIVLVNVVYFKGRWLYSFNPAHFVNRFYVSEKDYVQREMMSVAEHFSYAKSTNLDAKIVRLPYTNRKLSMIIVLPNERMGYASLEKKLRKTSSSVFKNLSTRYGTVVLPQFEIVAEIDLNDPLSKLGLGVLFSDNAEFPDIADIPSDLKQRDAKLVVSKIKQKVYIKVDANGTEAAAVTSVNMGLSLPAPKPPPPFVFIADHPFLFFLEYSTSAASHILFQGRVTKV